MSSELPEGCLGFDEDLSALIDEELSPRREAEVRAHLDACARCGARLQELCNVDLALAELAAPVVAPELARGLAERIAAEPASAAPGRARSAPPRPARRWLGRRAVARIAAAAGVVLALWLALRSGEVSEPPPLARAPVPEAAPAPEAPAPAPEQPGTLLAQEPAPAETGLPDLPEEDLEMLLVLDEVEDLDVIANLELLETLTDLRQGARG